MNAAQKYDARAAEVQSLLCVGLDPAPERLPPRFQHEPFPQFSFNQYVIEQTHRYVSAYKPNSAFYEARGAEGMHELEQTLRYLREQHPDILIICDAKRGDNANSNAAYASALFDRLGVDAVTLQPYMGSAVLAPFLARADKGCIVLCRTSSAHDDELQELRVQAGTAPPVPLWQTVAERVRDVWNARGNCMLVVGATRPEIMRRVRQLASELTLLSPGIGAQGGDLEQAVRAGINAAGRGLILSASRSVIFSDDPGAEARALRDAINRARN